MNDSDKLKKLAETAGCCSSNKMPSEIATAAIAHGVQLEDDDACKAAQFRLCPKTAGFPEFLWPEGVVAGVCSVCKEDVGWTPGVPGPTLLICIDCALKESGEETITE